MPYAGEVAALATAACWSCTTLLFTFVVERVGAFGLNLLRITGAALLLTILTLLSVAIGPLPGAPVLEATHGITAHALWLLAWSGWIGLTAGDWAYLKSLHLLGPRIATLVSALAPPLAAALGAAFLGETLGARGVLGMGLTLAGIALVVLERGSDPAPRGHRIRGTVFGVLGALAQAVNLVLSKFALAGGIGPLPAAATRMVAAALGVWLLLLLTRRRIPIRELRVDRRVPAALVAAIVFGPVTGIWLSLIAVQRTQTGIAATLMSLVPVLVLPLVVVFRHERVTARGVLGALVAVGGVAVLFSR